VAKRNWDLVRKQQNADKLQYRDVYEDQQMERSKLPAKQTATARTIFAIVVALMAAGAAYAIACVFGSLFSGLGDIGSTDTGSGGQGTVIEQPSETASSTGVRIESGTVIKDSVVVISTTTGETLDTWVYTNLDNGDVRYICDAHPGYSFATEYEIADGYKNGVWYLDEAAQQSATSVYWDYHTTWMTLYRGDPNGEHTEIDTWENTGGVYGEQYTCSNHPSFSFSDQESVEAHYDSEGNWSDTVVSQGNAGQESSTDSGDMPSISFGVDWTPSFGKILFAIAVGGIVFALLHTAMMRNLKAQNMLSDTSDINQYQNDQHIALPEEIQEKFDWFPDVGATSDVQFSSMISHMALSNKGIKKVKFSKRADKDIYDADGDIEYYKGEVLLDDNGQPIQTEVPMFDEQFMEDLFTASGAPPKDKTIRKYYDATKIKYNPDGSNRDKLGKYNTVADLINADWELPYYEPQRPAGAYIVDTAPVNTMVLAITRAGKGQTVIEPTLDMWMRERRPNNMVINDPKGELLVKNYVRATVRGFQVVQFNLINAMKTDIYNPLGMAAEAAREGDFTKCAMYVENIADVFFPLDGGDDPVWPNAANNAFKRASYGLIDYYLEEEKELRLFAERTKMDEKILEAKLDEMWGKVTLYNTYQLFVQLTSKKLKNPSVEFAKKAKEGEYDNLSDEDYDIELNKVERQSLLWEDKPECDLLTLYFNATDALPRNSMRTLVANANNALKAMAGAEKMMASVYGIAITAMSFFTDPTISTLTSGTPSQNVDLAGLSFPRRLGVRFNSDFVHNYHLIGMQAKWMSYEDDKFTKELGKDFYHEDLITREGWAKYYFKGKYPNDVAYVKLSIVNPKTELTIRTFYFQFKKNYQTSLDGRKYVLDPVLNEKIVKNGILTELRPFRQETKDGKQVLVPLAMGEKPDANTVYKKGKTTFAQDKIINITGDSTRGQVQTNAIIRTMARYAEKPKMVFLVTPPHLMKYAKLILILIKQLVDLNFDQSYMTKSNQKPLYKTRFMLDELGNLQSEGHGISGFETMLSIGLGQEQQFTLILQTLQQLRDVYGDSVDKIVQGNTSNIVFLKSTDDSMLDTLQKMSGTTHKSFTDSKTVTRDMQEIFQGMSANEGKASYTMTTKEVPVISYNDMAFISERNSIVFRAGDAPIWNRNETILPMSWRLFKNTITQPGKEYTLQTIPTLSSAIDFDVRKNQPDFQKMLDKRMAQANKAPDAKSLYQMSYDFTDYQMEQQDPDILADEIMDIINTYIREANTDEEEEEVFDYDFGEDDMWGFAEDDSSTQEMVSAIANGQSIPVNGVDKTFVGVDKTASEKRFAGGLLSPDMLVNASGINHSLDKDIIKVYTDIKGDLWRDTAYFVVRNGDLYGINNEPYIIKADNSEALEVLNNAAKDEDSNVYGDEDIDISEVHSFGTYTVTDGFYRFLAGQKRWSFANGKFEEAMYRQLDS